MILATKRWLTLLPLEAELLPLHIILLLSTRTVDFAPTMRIKGQTT